MSPRDQTETETQFIHCAKQILYGLWTFRSRNETAYNSPSNFRALESLSEPNEEKE